MPLPLPNKQQITVQMNEYPAQYCMPSMQMATDHYSIGYVISGDRHCITPLYCYDYHTGNVCLSPPFILHRTLSGSDIPYKRYLIKFSPEFIQPFCKQVGKNIFEELLNQTIFNFSVDSQKKIERMFREMYEEYQKEMSYREIILQGMLYRLITTIWEDRISGGTTRFSTPLTEPIIEAIALINDKFNSPITLETVAHSIGLSAAYFSRLFHSQLGKPFSDYLCDVRIVHAKTMLIRSSKSIMEIALESGFCNGDYLSTQFKKKTGMTPTAFRKAAGVKNNDNTNR
ncbi:MAG: AraC family transcriptional regulator [Lachnospiraceae bacterium]|nr:AraC family transcriptional regulator [Lachnospiraceae bacterium]